MPQRRFNSKKNIVSRRVMSVRLVVCSTALAILMIIPLADVVAQTSPSQIWLIPPGDDLPGLRVPEKVTDLQEHLNRTLFSFFNDTSTGPNPRRAGSSDTYGYRYFYEDPNNAGKVIVVQGNLGLDNFLRQFPSARFIGDQLITDTLLNRTQQAENPPPSVASTFGQLLGGRIVGIIGTILGIFLWIVSLLFGFLSKLVATLLLLALQFDTFAPPTVVNAWQMMRNLANMFFIIILVMIAFATMLKIESYQWKSLLPRLFIMAVLVNFSMTIALFLIDIFQIIMLTFVRAIMQNNVTGENFVSALGVSADIFHLVGSSIYSIFGLGADGPILIVMAMMLAFFYTVSATAIMLMMLVILVFRIVVLWVLIIFAPLAYLFQTFPQGAKYASMWWEKFTSQIIIGPVLAFFIWLGLKITENNQGGKNAPSGFENWGDINASALLNISGSTNNQALDQGTQAVIDPTRFVNLLVATSIFAGGMMIANQMGVVGGEMAKEWAGKLTGFGKLATLGAFARIGKAGYNAADRYLARHPIELGHGENAWKFSLSPTAIGKGWHQMWELAKHEAFTKAEGDMADFFFRRLNVTFGTGRLGGIIPLGEAGQPEALSGRETVLGRRAEKAHISQTMTQYAGADLSEEKLTRLFIRARAKGNLTEQEALAKLIVRNNMQDGFAARYYNETGHSIVDEQVMQQIDINAKNALAVADVRNMMDWDELLAVGAVTRQRPGPSAPPAAPPAQPPAPQPSIPRPKGVSAAEWAKLSPEGKRIAHETVERLRKESSEKYTERETYAEGEEGGAAEEGRTQDLEIHIREDVFLDRKKLAAGAQKMSEEDIEKLKEFITDFLKRRGLDSNDITQAQYVDARNRWLLAKNKATPWEIDQDITSNT